MTIYRIHCWKLYGLPGRGTRTRGIFEIAALRVSSQFPDLQDSRRFVQTTELTAAKKANVQVRISGGYSGTVGILHVNIFHFFFSFFAL